jgi:hypothetical protein
MAQAQLSGPFSRRALAWLVGVGACSLGLGVAFLVAGAPESAEVRSAGADAFSRSALGHRAFVRLMQRQGIPVLVSRHDSAGRANPSGVLVLAEPRLDAEDSLRARRLSQMLEEAGTALLVLPKWTGAPDPARPAWIRDAAAVPVPAVARVLSAARVPARVARQPRSGTEACEGLEAPVSLVLPQLLVPTTDDLAPLVTCEGGTLLGVVEREDRSLYVLSDPDLIANHGLAREQNALAVRELVELVGEGERALVLDEVLHGHERVPSLWRELFAFPLLPAVVQAALALGALVLAGLTRFGAPVPAGLGLAAGKSLLIENTAFLLRSAGHSGHTLGRYFDAALAEVGHALHAPPGTGRRELVALARAAAARRRTRVDPLALEAEVERLRHRVRSPAAVVAAARRVHRFKEEMRRGPQDHPGR